MLFCEQFTTEDSHQLRPRAVSVSGTALQEAPPSDYLEIASIPPLPLYALLAVDEDGSAGLYTQRQLSVSNLPMIDIVGASTALTRSWAIYR